MTGAAFVVFSLVAFFAGYGVSAWSEYHPRWWWMRLVVGLAVVAVPILEGSWS